MCLSASKFIHCNPVYQVENAVGKGGERQMPNQLHTLSARTVATLTKPGRHSDGGGLYLNVRSEEHTFELQSRQYLVCRLLLEKTNKTQFYVFTSILTSAFHRS